MSLSSTLHLNNTKLFVNCTTGKEDALNTEYMVLNLGETVKHFCGVSGYDNEPVMVDRNNELLSAFLTWEQGEQIAKAILSHIQQQQELQMKEGELING